MLKKILPILLTITLVAQYCNAQSGKKILTDEEYQTWNRIRNTQISDDGEWVTYTLSPEEKNGTLQLYQVSTNTTTTFDRASKAEFDTELDYMIFTIQPPKSLVDSLRRKKVKKENLPADTLAIYNLSEGTLQKIGNAKKIVAPDQWGGWVFVELNQVDSVLKKKMVGKLKKGDSNWLTINLSTGNIDTLYHISELALCKRSPVVGFVQKTNDSLHISQLFIHEMGVDNRMKLFEDSTAYLHHLVFDDSGEQMTLLKDSKGKDKVFQKQNELLYWTKSSGLQTLISTADDLRSGWIISSNQKPYFSENGKRLFFGTSPEPVVQDTNLLDHEIVNVEVWNYQDRLLYTMQEARLEEEKKRTYLQLFDLEQFEWVPLADQEVDQIRFSHEKEGTYAIGFNAKPYQQLMSWEGNSYRDIYRMNLLTGDQLLIAEKLEGNPRLSPGNRYTYYYNRPDSAWFIFDLLKLEIAGKLGNESSIFYDEENDRPMYPYGYGSAGWTTDDASLLVYDQFDIWEIDPSTGRADRLTDGREDQLEYRIVRFHPDDDPYIDPTRVFIHTFDQRSKSESYLVMNLKTGEIFSQFSPDARRLQNRPHKARNSDQLVFTQENFQVFPNLWTCDLSFSSPIQISDANPQQKDYKWGSIEEISWTVDGREFTGLLAKPEDFDPNKKYPMLVNFYERSTDGIHRHRAPSAGRSTINYSYYVSNGYLIFNPDVYYREGYPGESAYETVVPGTKYLIEQGFVDEDRIGIQGHSWGGYQIAYILTKSGDLFACAEAGAPVVNMVSAYGGIRWGSGMSRMFQYEHTQSRIGSTLWEKPDLYLSNSPIFETDQIETPVLILHNDEDGAVPWYQGIEFFVALRRLGKPAWMLNYNGEPHWPVKYQNRIDFNKRLSQFFNHYLKDDPMPKWMHTGVPATHKGIKQGYELLKTNKS